MNKENLSHELESLIKDKKATVYDILADVQQHQLAINQLQGRANSLGEEIANLTQQLNALPPEMAKEAKA